MLHAILLALDLLVIYLFVLALTKSNWVALPMAAAFLGVSVVPVYFVWLVPELFNVSLAFYAVFFWAYKEVARERLTAAGSRILAGPASDYLAAVAIALATFSKPPHLLLLAPMVLLAAMRFQWKRTLMILAVCGGVTAGLFAANAAITGEFNYQGGDRKTFYHYTGFPFANAWETFDNIGPVRGREDLLLGDVLVNTHSGTVFRHNLWYFFAGRNAGLLPYFFPGVLALALFLVSKQKQTWQWLALATIAGVDRDAPVRLAVHMERRRRADRQPLLPGVLCAVSGADSRDGRRGRGARRVCRRGAVYGANPAEPVFRVKSSRRAHQVGPAAPPAG